MQKIVLLLVLLGQSGSAALFSYTDEKGTKHVVSSADEIPEKYRSSSKAAGGDSSSGTATVGSAHASAATIARLNIGCQTLIAQSMEPKSAKPNAKKNLPLLCECTVEHATTTVPPGLKAEEYWSIWNDKRWQEMAEYMEKGTPPVKLERADVPLSTMGFLMAAGSPQVKDCLVKKGVPASEL